MANVSKSAVMVFARDAVEGSWKWGEDALPNVSKYTYLGIDFGCLDSVEGNSGGGTVNI